MYDENDESAEDLEWAQLVEGGLEEYATLGFGHVSPRRAQDVVNNSMLAAGEGRDLKLVTSAMVSGASRRNLIRIAQRRGVYENITLVRVVLSILARVRPTAISSYSVLKEVCQVDKYKEVDQVRVEEVLEDMVAEGWVLKEGMNYRLIDKTLVQGQSSRYARRMKLIAHRTAIHGSLTAFLKGEASANFHVVTFYGTADEFAGMMNFIQLQIVEYHNLHNEQVREIDHESEFKLLIFTRCTKPR